MRLTTDQIMADRARMEKFICERIPDDGTRIDLGNGACADLMPFWDDQFGWSLHWETNEPEWVDLWEVYQYFRNKEMTSREWWAELEGEMARSKVCKLEKEIAVLHRVKSSEPAPDSGEAMFPQALARVEHQLTEISAKLDGLDDLRELIGLHEDDPSFTVLQVAQKLQVSPTKVYQLTESGKLKSYKTGHQVRIKASHIREYQTRHTRTEETKRKRSGSFNKSEADRLFGPGWDN